jgi:hypothetical protein
VIIRHKRAMSTKCPRRRCLASRRRSVYTLTAAGPDRGLRMVSGPKPWAHRRPGGPGPPGTGRSQRTFIQARAPASPRPPTLGNRGPGACRGQL